MKFHLDGVLVIAATPERTYRSLCDPKFMVSTVPDLQSYRILDQDHFDAKIKVGMSIVRGTVDMKFELKDKVETKHARLIGDGGGAGSKMHIDSTFDLSPDGQGTKMAWSADADLGGLIAGIGAQILKGQSEKQVSEIFSNIKQKLEGPDGQT
jgi:carbon monoxide dehydrogenase subunit G